jgi:hypothetical protein
MSSHTDRSASQVAAGACQVLEQLLGAVTSLERHLAPDVASPGSPAVTPFHSSAVPPVPLAQYAHRIVHFSGYGAFGVQIGLALLGRYTKATGRVPTPLTAHRLLATCIIVGMKANCDLFVRNDYMAQIAGISLRELNALEITFLKTIDFAVVPTEDEVIRIPQRLRVLDAAAIRRHRHGAVSKDLVAALCFAVPNAPEQCLAGLSLRQTTSCADDVDVHELPTPQQSPIFAVPADSSVSPSMATTEPPSPDPAIGAAAVACQLRH